MNVNTRKSEYMSLCVTERKDNGTMRTQEEVTKVDDFKYLGVQRNGECGREVKKRMHAGWNG